MTPENKNLKCEDCGKDFVFTAEEQDFYREKGFENEPKRCLDCRRTRKRERADRRNSGPKTMTTVTCDQCGKQDQVPFTPTPGKPILCSECFSQKRPPRR